MVLSMPQSFIDPTKEMSTMVTATYKVKVPGLVKRLKFTESDGTENIGLNAMDLVRLTGIAVNSAYQAIDKERSQKTSLDTCWKIYAGFLKQGVQIHDEGQYRNVEWSDIVEI